MRNLLEIAVGQYIPWDGSIEPGFLNNFFCHFVAGNDPYPMVMPAGYNRTMLADYWDMTPREIIQGLHDFSSESQEAYLSDKSDKRLGQSARKFYAEVDATVLEIGLSLGGVSRAINIYLHDRDSDPSCDEALDRVLIPIYRALREKGYNRSDLW